MKKWSVYAPVVIPTLCRYEHFKRCVDSLSRCTGAEYTELYIGLDYPFNESHVEGHNKICEYVKTITGFKSVIVLKRETNYGVERNVKDLRDRVQEKYDRHIFSEDDNEFAPDFLEYMNACLEKYKDNPDVIRICGYLIDWTGCYENSMRTYPYNAFPAKDFNASGCGIWFAKMPAYIYSKDAVLNSWHFALKAIINGYCSAVDRMIYQVYKESQLPDVAVRLYCAFNNKFCIFPTVSKVRNWGYDGTGLNSDNNPKFITAVQLDKESNFSLDDFEIRDYKEVKRFIYKMFGAPPKHPFLWIRVLNRYLFFRLTGLRSCDVKGKKQKLKVLISAIFGRIIK